MGAQALLAFPFRRVKWTTKQASVVANCTVAGPSKDALFCTQGAFGTDCSEEKVRIRG